MLLGGFWSCWVIALILANLTLIYKFSPQAIFLTAFFGGIILSGLGYFHPRLYLPILIIYFGVIGLSFYLYDTTYLIITLALPMIIVIIALFYKSQLIAILSTCFCIVFMILAFLSSYMIIQTQAGHKCIFFKNDGHFKPATLSTYSNMLYPIIFQSHIPTGALLILSDAQYPDKRWILSTKGNLIEIHNFSATLSGETQCNPK